MPKKIKAAKAAAKGAQPGTEAGAAGADAQAEARAQANAVRAERLAHRSASAAQTEGRQTGGAHAREKGRTNEELLNVGNSKAGTRL